jgi:hypothetical protein
MLIIQTIRTLPVINVVLPLVKMAFSGDIASIIKNNGEIISGITPFIHIYMDYVDFPKGDVSWDTGRPMGHGPLGHGVPLGHGTS